MVKPERLRSTWELAALLAATAIACADLHAPPEGNSAGTGGASTTSAGAATSAGNASVAGSMTNGSGGSSSAGGDGIPDGMSGGTSMANGGQASAGSSVQGGTSLGGAAGSIDSAGTGGAQTAGGNAGDAGSTAAAGASMGSGGSSSCGKVTSGEVHAWLFPELTNEASNEIHPFLALTTTGMDIPLSEITVRYYFSAEASGDWQIDCVWVTQPSGSGGGLCNAGVSITIVDLDPPAPEADHYLQVSFADVKGAMLSRVTAPVIEARSMFWRSGHPMLNQANDYSFTPTTNQVMTVEGRDYKQTSKVAVYRRKSLIWGEEPCP